MLRWMSGVVAVMAATTGLSAAEPLARAPVQKTQNLLARPLAASEAQFIEAALQPLSPGACKVLSPDPGFVKEMLVDLDSIGAPGGPKHQRRVALVVGNGAYASISPLRNPSNDAESAARLFQALGFTVVGGRDLTAAALEQCLTTFRQNLNAGGAAADVSLFYYAGHGVQFASQTDSQSRNYMLAIDAKIDAAGKATGFKQIDAVLSEMRTHSKQAVFLYDACRNAPFDRGAVKAIDGRSVRAADASGAAEIDETPTATAAQIFISYATALGKTAEDGTGDHSPYTQALLKHLPTSGLTIDQAVAAAAGDVEAATNKQQTPWIASSITTALRLNGKVAKGAVESQVADFAAQSAGHRERGKRGQAIAAALKGLPVDWAKGGPEHIEARKALSQAENDRRVLFTGHGGGVSVAAVSPDANLVATGSVDGTAKIWDAATGALRHTLNHHANFGPGSVRFSADGRLLATASVDGTTKVWDVSSGALKTTVSGLVGAFSPDGRRLATGADNHAVRIFDAATGTPQLSATAAGERIADLAFSPDGRFVAAASMGRVEILDTAGGAPVKALDVPAFEPDPMVENISAPRPARVWRVAWSPDGRRLWAAGETLGIWDTANWALLPTGGFGQRRASQGLAVSADGTRVIVAASDAVGVFSADGGGVRSLGGVNIVGVGLSPGNEPIVIAAAGKEARLADARLVSFMTAPPGMVSAKHLDLDLDATGARYATASSGPSSAAPGLSSGAFLWTSDGAFLRRLSAPASASAAAAGASAVRFSLDASRIAVAWLDGSAVIFDAASGATIRQLGQPGGEPLTGVAWSPDGAKIATSDNTGAIRVWNAATGDAAFSLAAEKGPLRLAFTPNGRIMTLSSEGVIEMWEGSTGAPLPRIEAGSFGTADVALSSTGDLAIASGGDIRIGSKPLAQGLGPISRIAFTRDGRFLALMENGELAVWDVATGQELDAGARLGNAPVGLAVSRDGRVATTAGPTMLVRHIGLYGETLQKTAKSELTDDLRIEVERDRIRFWEIKQELLQ